MYEVVSDELPVASRRCLRHDTTPQHHEETLLYTCWYCGVYRATSNRVAIMHEITEHKKEGLLRPILTQRMCKEVGLKMADVYTTEESCAEALRLVEATIRSGALSVAALEVCYMYITGLAQLPIAQGQAAESLAQAVVQRVDDFHVLDVADTANKVDRCQMAATAGAWNVCVSWLLTETVRSEDVVVTLVEQLLAVVRGRPQCVNVQRLCFYALQLMPKRFSMCMCIAYAGGLHTAVQVVQAHQSHAPQLVSSVCCMVASCLAKSDSRWISELAYKQWHPLVMQLLQQPQCTSKVLLLAIEVWACERRIGATANTDTLVASILTAIQALVHSCKPAVLKRAVAVWASNVRPTRHMLHASTMRIMCALAQQDLSFDMTNTVNAICHAVNMCDVTEDAERQAVECAADFASNLSKAGWLRSAFMRMVAACSQCNAEPCTVAGAGGIGPSMCLPPSPLLQCVLTDKFARLCPTRGFDATAPWRVSELAGMVASFLACTQHGSVTQDTVTLFKTTPEFIHVLCRALTRAPDERAVRCIARALRKVGNQDTTVVNAVDALTAALSRYGVAEQASSTTVIALVKALTTNTVCIARSRMSMSLQLTRAEAAVLEIQKAMSAKQDDMMVQLYSMRALACVNRMQLLHGVTLAPNTVKTCLKKHGADADIRDAIVALL